MKLDSWINGVVVNLLDVADRLVSRTTSVEDAGPVLVGARVLQEIYNDVVRENQAANTAPAPRAKRKRPDLAPGGANDPLPGVPRFPRVTREATTIGRKAKCPANDRGRHTYTLTAADGRKECKDCGALKGKPPAAALPGVSP